MFECMQFGERKCAISTCPNPPLVVLAQARRTALELSAGLVRRGIRALAGLVSVPALHVASFLLRPVVKRGIIAMRRCDTCGARPERFLVTADCDGTTCGTQALPPSTFRTSASSSGERDAGHQVRVLRF